jgi:hypothetical protein
MVEFIPNGISFIKIQNRLAYMSAPCGTTGALGWFFTLSYNS